MSMNVDDLVECFRVFWPRASILMQRMLWASPISTCFDLQMFDQDLLSLLSFTEHDVFSFLAARLRCTSVERIYTDESFLPGRIPVTPQYSGKMAEWKSMVLRRIARPIQCSKRTTCSFTWTKLSLLLDSMAFQTGFSNCRPWLLTQFLVTGPPRALGNCWWRLAEERAWHIAPALSHTTPQVIRIGHTLKQIRSRMVEVV